MKTLKAYAARVKVKTKVIWVKPKKAFAVDLSRVIFAVDFYRVENALVFSILNPVRDPLDLNSITTKVDD